MKLTLPKVGEFWDYRKSVLHPGDYSDKFLSINLKENYCCIEDDLGSFIAGLKWFYNGCLDEYRKVR